MKLTGLQVAVATVVVSNLFVLGNAARNRTGDPEAELTLTECELRLDPPHKDNSLASARLLYENTASRRPAPGQPAEVWFGEAKLRELGFDTGGPVDVVREAYIAFEHDGAAWERATDRAAAAPRTTIPSMGTPDQQLEIHRRTQSKLITVDAGLDPVALRQRHPDRRKVMILRGRVRMVRDTDRNPRGVVDGLTRATIHVPMPFAQRMEAPAGCWHRIENDGSLSIGEPRYRITIRTGARYEPWVAGLEYRIGSRRD